MSTQTEAGETSDFDVDYVDSGDDDDEYTPSFQATEEATLNEYSKVASKCRKINGLIHSSTRLSDLLEQKQREINGKTQSFTPKRLIQEVCTRWNSSYLMMARILELSDAINMTLKDDSNKNKYGHLLISEADIVLLEAFTTVLSFFYEATLKLCSNDVTISLYLSPSVTVFLNYTQLETKLA